jgi:hypothetical protein
VQNSRESAEKMLMDLGNSTSGGGRRRRRTGVRNLAWVSILACAAVLALDFLPGAEAGSRVGRRAVSRDGRSKYVDREMFEDSLHHLRQVGNAWSVPPRHASAPIFRQSGSTSKMC